MFLHFPDSSLSLSRHCRFFYVFVSGACRYVIILNVCLYLFIYININRHGR